MEAVRIREGVETEEEVLSGGGYRWETGGACARTA